MLSNAVDYNLIEAKDMCEEKTKTMKIKLARLAATLCLSLSFIPCLSAQDSLDDLKFTKPSFTRNELNNAMEDPDYFTIDPASIKTTILEVREEPNRSYVKMNEISDPKYDLLVTLDSLINIASKVWKIVVDNAPQVNIDTKYAVAYPQGITSASQLEKWTKPLSYVYGFSAKNLYGVKTIDVEYKAIYTYGGSYKGKGRFLTAVTIIPTKVNVSWGYRFAMTASVPDSTITNVGTNTNPVAAMQLKLLWKISTALKESDGASVYYMQGDGYFEEIASPFSKTPKIEDLTSALPLIGGAKIFE